MNTDLNIAPSFSQVLADCSAQFGLQTSWASEPNGACPELHPANSPYRWQGVPPNLVLLIVVFYLFASGTDWVLARTSLAFCQLDVKKRRHVTTYVIKLVGMTVSFALTLGYGGTLIFTGEFGSAANLTYMKLGLLIMMGVYLFELLYRIEIGRLISVHHLMFCFLVVYIVLYAYDTSPSREAARALRIALVMSLLGNTEQLTVLGVILYRLGSLWSPRVLKVSRSTFQMRKYLK